MYLISMREIIDGFSTIKQELVFSINEKKYSDHIEKANAICSEWLNKLELTISNLNKEKEAQKKETEENNNDFI